jgi:hypothetical protein
MRYLNRIFTRSELGGGIPQGNSPPLLYSQTFPEPSFLLARKSSMKIFCGAVVLLVGNLVAFAQSHGACGQSLDLPLRPRAALAIDSRPAGLEIVGTDQPMMHVSCTAGEGEDAQPIRIRFSGNSDGGKLTIEGGSLHQSNFQVRIEVPRKTSLKVHMPAGQVKIEEIAGDKDIDLYAGQITISSARLWDYRNVDVSVIVGQVSARVYGADKGGFFRSFTKQTADGEYSLRAHVTTGQIELLGTHPPPAAE